MRISLVSPDVKSDLRYEARSQRVMFFGFLALTVLVWFILLLGGMTVFAEMKSAQTLGRIEALRGKTEHRDIEAFSRELKIARRDIERLNAVQAQHSQFACVLRKLISILPEGVVLSDLAIDSVDRKVTFAGTAPKRSELLLLRDRLAANPDYTAIVLPLDLLLKEIKPSFSISFELTPKALTSFCHSVPGPSVSP